MPPTRAPAIVTVCPTGLPSAKSSAAVSGPSTTTSAPRAASSSVKNLPEARVRDLTSFQLVVVPTTRLVQFVVPTARVVVVLVATGWMGVARMIRAEVLGVTALPYVQSGVGLGASVVERRAL